MAANSGFNGLYDLPRTPHADAFGGQKGVIHPANRIYKADFGKGITLEEAMMRMNKRRNGTMPVIAGGGDDNRDILRIKGRKNAPEDDNKPASVADAYKVAGGSAPENRIQYVPPSGEDERRLEIRLMDRGSSGSSGSLPRAQRIVTKPATPEPPKDEDFDPFAPPAPPTPQEQAMMQQQQIPMTTVTPQMLKTRQLMQQVQQFPQTPLAPQTPLTPEAQLAALFGMYPQSPLANVISQHFAQQAQQQPAPAPQVQAPSGQDAAIQALSDRIRGLVDTVDRLAENVKGREANAQDAPKEKSPFEKFAEAASGQRPAAAAGAAVADGVALNDSVVGHGIVLSSDTPLTYSKNDEIGRYAHGRYEPSVSVEIATSEMTFRMNVVKAMSSRMGVVLLMPKDNSFTFMPKDGQNVTLTYGESSFPCKYTGISFELDEMDSIGLCFIKIPPERIQKAAPVEAPPAPSDR